jgi:hypothetical protein
VTIVKQLSFTKKFNTKKMSTTTTLPTYRILGSTGLRVFPLCLGTSHFGQSERMQSVGVGASEEECEKVFLKYLEVGGNFIGMWSDGN